MQMNVTSLVGIISLTEDTPGKVSQDLFRRPHTRDDIYKASVSLISDQHRSVLVSIMNEWIFIGKITGLLMSIIDINMWAFIGGGDIVQDTRMG